MTAQARLAGRSRRERYSLFLAGAILTILVSLLHLVQPTWLRFLDNRLTDSLLRSSPRGQTSGVAVVVDLDEGTLARFGQWPWPRYRLAGLLERLRESGAASIGLDMVLAEADRTSLRTLQRELLRDLQIRVEVSGLPASLMDHDLALARVLGRGPFVLGYKFSFPGEKESRGDCVLHPLSVTLVESTRLPRGPAPLFQAQDVVCNLRGLAAAAPASGFFNVAPDFDGILRRVPLVMVYGDRLYPSLSLATFMQAVGIRQAVLKVAGGGVESLQLGRIGIPLDARGNLRIRYRGPGRTLPRISAGDVLSGRVPQERLRGKIVFLGASAAGLGDVHPTPLDAVFPGVEVHATVVDNILKQDFLSQPPWAPGLELGLVVAFGVLSTALLARTGAVWSLLALALGIFGLWQGARWALHAGGLFLSPLSPMILVGANFSLLTALKYRQEERRAKARASDLALTQDFTILCLASLTETRHQETGRHILRTQRYVRCLCRYLASHPSYREFLDPETTEQFCKSAPLHDIGKVGVPDRILLKPGKLTPEEFEEVKKHATYGRDAIQRAEEQFGRTANSAFLRLAKEMAYCHHERWDGTGYPRNLRGEAIPLSGRIMAVADVYDTVTRRRVYKPAIPHEEAVLLIAEQRGTALDPDVVDAFLELQEEFRRIALECSDTEEAGTGAVPLPGREPRLSPAPGPQRT
jgi:HD-GYP domain-containing protein (c-di-GMP phosphodiesterase class II)